MRIVNRKSEPKKESQSELIKKQVSYAVLNLEVSPDKSQCGLIECDEDNISLFRAYLIRFVKEINSSLEEDRKYKTQKDPEGGGYIIWRIR